MEKHAREVEVLLYKAFLEEHLGFTVYRVIDDLSVS